MKTARELPPDHGDLRYQRPGAVASPGRCRMTGLVIPGQSDLHAHDIPWLQIPGPAGCQRRPGSPSGSGRCGLLCRSSSLTWVRRAPPPRCREDASPVPQFDLRAGPAHDAAGGRAVDHVAPSVVETMSTRSAEIRQAPSSYRKLARYRHRASASRPIGPLSPANRMRAPTAEASCSLDCSKSKPTGA